MFQCAHRRITIAPGDVSARRKWVFINQAITRNGVLVSTGVSKMVFKALNGKTIPPLEVFAQLGYDVDRAALSSSGDASGDENGAGTAVGTGGAGVPGVRTQGGGGVNRTNTAASSPTLPPALEGGRTFMPVADRAPALRSTAVDGWLFLERAMEALAGSGKRSKL